MAELFDFRAAPQDAPMPRDAVLAAMRGAEALVTTLSDRIDGPLLAEGAGRLRLIANYGSGLDHIDVEAARALGISVTNTPGVATEDTADMVMALILALTRRMPEGMARMQSGDWAGWSPLALLGQSLRGRRLGILGMGRIGLAVARRARAFGLQVHYHNRRRLHGDIESEYCATYWASLDQMVSRMDILSVNCPHTPSTYHLLNARRLRLMKPTAVIVNASRGEVVDETALTRMLRAGEIAGAGLDVYEQRAGINPRLVELPNVVLLPHMGSATLEGRVAMGERVILNLRVYADGHRPPDLALPGAD